MRVNKWGRLRIIRFLIVGWSLQSVHVLDRTEQMFRIVFEGGLLLLAFVFYSVNGDRANFRLIDYTFIFMAIHTLMFLFDSAILVGLRECFDFIKNPGINGTLSFLLLAKKLILATDAVECVLVYGSITRGMFHNRSDLDLRVIRKRDLWQSLHIMFIAVWLRAIAVWRYHIPLDLKVVDSMDYLKNEIRLDEKPIVIYCRSDFAVFNRGIDLEAVLSNPSMVLRPTRCHS